MTREGIVFQMKESNREYKIGGTKISEDREWTAVLKKTDFTKWQGKRIILCTFDRPQNSIFKNDTIIRSCSSNFPII